MHPRALIAVAALLLLLAGCHPAADSGLPSATVAATMPSDAAASAAPTVFSVPPPGATATPLPAPPTPIPTPTATPAPTAAPQVVVVAVPEWLPQLAAEPPPADARFIWEVRLADDPAAALLGGTAQAALLQVGDPLPAGLAAAGVGDRPVALVVPFTQAWESTSLDYAQQWLLPQADAQGNNFGWLAQPAAPFTLRDFAALTPRDKALAVGGAYPNEAGYELRQSWQVAGSAAAVDALQPWASARLNAEPLLTLAAVGDLMLDRALGYAIDVQGQVDHPFALVGDALRAADLTVGNLECALGSAGTPAPKSYTFRAPPAAAASVANAGFDVVSLANNHALDYGAQTLLEGIGLLAEQGVAVIGAGPDAGAARTPWITTVNGLTVALLAYVHVPVEVSGFDTAGWTATDATAGLAWADPALVAADVAAIAPQVDHVIVLLHSGYEYVAAPSPPQQAAARAAIDAGAALVIGHHAHILQGVEFYGEGVIVYGLGNFAFEIDGDPRTAILNVWLDTRGVRQISFTPAVIQFGGQPRLATPDEAADIRALIYRQSAVLDAD